MLRAVPSFHSLPRTVYRIQPRISPTRLCVPFVYPPIPIMPGKRKRSTVVPAVSESDRSSNTDPTRPRQRTAVPLPSNLPTTEPQPPRRQPSRTGTSAITNPDVNPEVIDGLSALRASPDGGEIADVGPALKLRKGKTLGADASVNGSPGLQQATAVETPGKNGRGQGRVKTSGAGAPKHTSTTPGSALETTTDPSDQQPGRNKRKKGAAQHVREDSAAVKNATLDAPILNGVAPSEEALEQSVGVTMDPEVDGALTGENEDGDEEDVKEALSRPPPVNSDYLPLPWKGRLGYVRTYTLRMHDKLTRVTGVPEHLLAQC
jgi:UV DNA damage endonuclease